MQNKEIIIEEFLKIGSDLGETISDIPCAKCGEEEAYLYKSYPYTVYCPRKNNCGEVTKLRNYFPSLVSSKKEKLDPKEEEEVYKNKAKHFVETQRGINKYEDLGGEYCTLDMEGRKYAALRFRLEDGETFNYRVIGHPNKKAYFDYGKPVGDLLFIPKQKFSYKKEVWIAESPLKAMALVLIGLNAVSFTSTSTNLKNSEFYKKVRKEHPKCKWVLALDNDSAGKKTIDKWLEWGRKNKEQFSVAYPPAIGIDWDDYYKLGLLKTMVARGETLGKIYVAKDLEEIKKLYALLVTQEELAISERNPEWWPQLVEFQGTLWKIYHKYIKKTDEFTYHSVLIFNGTFIHGYNYTTGGPLDRETTTVAKVKDTSGKIYDFKLTAEERVSSGALRKKLSDASLLQYNPSFNTIDSVMKDFLIVHRTPTVRHVERSGYDKESGCFVFPHFVINQRGRVIKPNQLGFFKYVNLHMSKDLVPKSFAPDFKDKFSHFKFLQLVYKAWGNNGIILVGYYISCYFSHLKCSGIDGTFPFVSFEGPPGCGKSTLISLLNMAFNFFASEGRPVNKTDTKKGVARDLAKYSSLCMPLLENRKEKAGWELLSEDMFLNLYGRNPAQTTAIKSMNLETRSVPFDAGIVMVWNHNTLVTKEVRDRFINVKVTVETGKPLFTKGNQQAKDELKKAGTLVSSIGLDILKKRNCFESEYLTNIEKAKIELENYGLSDVRYQDNFAHIIGSLRLYRDLFLKEGGIKDVTDTHNLIEDCILNLTNKAKTQSKETLGDAGLVLEFWEAFQAQIKESSSMNFDNRMKEGEHFVHEDGQIFIRPNKVFSGIGWEKTGIEELKSNLQRSHLFRGTKTKRSPKWIVNEGQSKALYTWVFELPFSKKVFKAA